MNLENLLDNSIIDGIRYNRHNVSSCIESIYEKFNFNNPSESIKEVVYYLAHAFVQNKSGFKVVASVNLFKANKILDKWSFESNIPITTKQYTDLLKLSNKIRELIN